MKSITMPPWIRQGVTVTVDENGAISLWRRGREPQANDDVGIWMTNDLSPRPDVELDGSVIRLDDCGIEIPRYSEWQDAIWRVGGYSEDEPQTKPQRVVMVPMDVANCPECGGQLEASHEAGDWSGHIATDCRNRRLSDAVHAFEVPVWHATLEKVREWIMLQTPPALPEVIKGELSARPGWPAALDQFEHRIFTTYGPAATLMLICGLAVPSMMNASQIGMAIIAAVAVVDWCYSMRGAGKRTSDD